MTQRHKYRWLHIYAQQLTSQRNLYLITLLAASSIIDISIGAIAIFPVYEQLASIAAHLQ